MNQEETTTKRYRPVIVSYAVSIIIGSGLSVALATYWLGLSSVWVAVVVGALLAILGTSMGEAIGDAIVLSLIIGVLVTLFITVGPEIAILRTGIVPAATGFCMGSLVAGVMKEISP